MSLNYITNYMGALSKKEACYVLGNNTMTHKALVNSFGADLEG